jgi:anti-sigma-K factor RskA
MTQESNDSFTENIPAYVLGALGWVEAAALQAHLETCPVCQAELARYQQISNGLATSLPLRIPSPSVRSKLLTSLEERKIPARPKNKWGLRQFAAGALALVLLSMNLIAFVQIRDLRQQHLQLADQIEKHHTILGMLAANTEVHPVSGDGFSGNLLLDREKNLAYLLTWNLPPPPKDQVYQIWLIDPNGEETAAGLFRPEVDRRFTSAALVTSRTFVEFVGIKVTLEPSGGSDKPTGEPILRVDY